MRARKRIWEDLEKAKGRWDDIAILQSQKINDLKILQAKQEWGKGHMKTAILETS